MYCVLTLKWRAGLPRLVQLLKPIFHSRGLDSISVEDLRFCMPHSAAKKVKINNIRIFKKILIKCNALCIWLLLYCYPLCIWLSYLNIYVGMIPQCTEKYYKFAYSVQSLKNSTNVIATIKFLLAVGMFYWCKNRIHSPTEWN